MLRPWEDDWRLLAASLDFMVIAEPQFGRSQHRTLSWMRASNVGIRGAF